MNQTVEDYAVFGDLHGDIESLKRFLDFIASRDNIHNLFFTGDFFGLNPDKKCNDVLKERDRQYRIIEELLNESVKNKRLLAIPGNYDSFFDEFFRNYDLHHKTIQIDGKKVYGHGGSHTIPSEIERRLKENGKEFYWKDFAFQDKEAELPLLIASEPDIILSHSPIRSYVNHHILRNQCINELVYLGGHTHVYTYHMITDPSSERNVCIIRPGALGRTISSNKKSFLPQTFMIVNPKDLTSCYLLTLENNQFKERTITLEQRALQEYNESEGKWKT